jgi:sugar/nucleoside kinase (ribokinase family)
VIALVGQSVLDRITEPGREPEERLGGAPIFAGHAIEQTNRRAIIITRGGTPELRAPLRELGLEVVEGPSDATFISVLELFADGTRNHEVASFGTPFTPADVEGWMAPALEGIEVVVCGTQWRQDFEAPVLAALAAGGRTVLLDGQGPLRTARLGPLLLRRELEAAELAGVAVLKLAEDEADALGALHDLTQLAGLAVPTVIVTRGHVGSTVRTSGRTVEVPGDPVLGLADTVGAGDMFLALVGAALGEGAEPVEAARVASFGVATLLRLRLHPAAWRHPSERRGATPGRRAGDRV